MPITLAGTAPNLAATGTAAGPVSLTVGGPYLDNSVAVAVPGGVFTKIDASAVTAAGAVTLIGNGIGNFLQAPNSATRLEGLGDSDSLYGGTGADTLIGGSNQDTMEGGGGDDLLIIENAPQVNGYVEVIRGDGGGADVLRLVEGAAHGLQLSTITDIEVLEFSANGSATMTVAQWGQFMTITGGAGTNTLEFFDAGTFDMSGKSVSSIEVITLSSGNDVFTAPSNVLTLNGGSGDDSITAGDGDVTLIGGAGKDTLRGGNGGVTLVITSPSDLVAGEIYDAGAAGPSDTLLLSTAGTYDLTTVTLTNVELVSGSSGSDIVSLTKGQIASLSDGVNLAAGTGDRLIITGATGTVTDTIVGAEELILNATAGVTMTLTAARTTVVNGAFADVFTGSALADLVFLDGGNDTMTGGVGADTLMGEAGDDSLSGGNDADRLFGGDNADVLAGDGGDDVLVGGLGNDTLKSGAGVDTLHGGAGNDSLIADSAGDTGNWFIGDALTDTGNDTVEGGDGNDTAIGGNGNDNLSGEGGNDQLVGGSGDDTLTGGAGADTLWGGNGIDLFRPEAGPGADLIVDWQAGEQIFMGFGFDFTTFSDTQNNTGLVQKSTVTLFDNGLTLTFTDGGTLTIIGMTSLTQSAFTFGL